MTAPEPTPVVLLPNGNIAYKMPAWWREIGPDGKDYGNLPVLPKGAVRMVPAPQPDPDIRAQAIEVLARLHGCAEWDETQHDATAKRGQHAAIVRDIDALAEAGLLPTPSAVAEETYTCAKCGAQNPGWLAFETGWPNRIRYWCLGHIPWTARVRLWWQERRDL